MEVATLLTGAAIALGSASLGVVSEAIKGWISRRTNIEDRRKAFQHRTAIELQEALHDVAQEVQQVFLWYMIKYNQTKQWGDPSMPPGTDKDSTGKARQRALVLVERLDDGAVRQSVYAMLESGPKVLTADDLPDAVLRQEAYSDHCVAVNKQLGTIIRESWPD